MLPLASGQEHLENKNGAGAVPGADPIGPIILLVLLLLRRLTRGKGFVSNDPEYHGADKGQCGTNLDEIEDGTGFHLQALFIWPIFEATLAKKFRRKSK